MSSLAAVRKLPAHPIRLRLGDEPDWCTIRWSAGLCRCRVSCAASSNSGRVTRWWCSLPTASRLQLGDLGQHRVEADVARIGADRSQYRRTIVDLPILAGESIGSCGRR